MIPLWFCPMQWPAELLILKPSEKVPLTGARLAGVYRAGRLPGRRVPVVNGAKEPSTRSSIIR